MERFHTIFFVAGIGCFAMAFLLSLVFPWMTMETYHGMEFQNLATLAAEPSDAFVELSETYPGAFAEHYGEVTPESYADALQLGRDVYVGQACWHCHSQYIRVVSNEQQRFGTPSAAQDYQNALSLPHLWGTRRVGPDLSRQGGIHSNDWHVAHMIHPKNVVSASVMPSYGFWFEDDGTPKKKGFAIISYLQWLGTESLEARNARQQ